MLKRAFAAVVAVITAAILVLPAIANPGPQPVAPPADVDAAGRPADPADRGRGQQVAGRGCYPPGRAGETRPECDDDGKAVTGPPGRMTGQVEDRDGNPVAGARVTCDGVTATADFEGTFAVLDLVPGTYRCRAVGPAPLEPVRRVVNVGPGQTVDVTLVFR